MDFWFTIGTLLRRKRVVLPVILFAALLGAGVYVATPAAYVSTATMVLTTTEYGGTESQDPTKPTDLTNPMLNFNDSLKTTSAILIESMSTKEVAVQLGAVGDTKLVVDDGSSNPNLLGLDGPFLSITATSTSRTTARGVAMQARQLLGEKLRSWQSALAAPKKTYVNLADVVSPTAPEPDHAPAIKRALTAVFGGLLFGLTAAYAGTRLLELRRRRVTEPAPATAPAPSGTVAVKPRPSLQVAEVEADRSSPRPAALAPRLRKS